MSGMKSLLGDMTFEEFEEMRRDVLEKLRDRQWTKFEEEYCENARQLYNYWLQIGGRVLIHNWVHDHGGCVLESEIVECMYFMFDSFVDWLESFE